MHLGTCPICSSQDTLTCFSIKTASFVCLQYLTQVCQTVINTVACRCVCVYVCTCLPDLQEDLNAAHDLNEQLADQIQDLESQLDSFNALEQQHDDLLKLKRQKSAELADFRQQATRDYDSYMAQSQLEVDDLNARIRSEQRRSQSLQTELHRAQAYIESAQGQADGQQILRSQNGQDLRILTSNSSLSRSMRSPRSPSGSSESSGTSRASKPPGAFPVSKQLPSAAAVTLAQYSIMLMLSLSSCQCAGCCDVSLFV